MPMERRDEGYCLELLLQRIDGSAGSISHCRAELDLVVTADF